MDPVLRAVGGVVAGILIAVAAFILGEILSAVIHPFPEGFKGTEEEVVAHVARYPDWALAACAPIWVIGAYIATKVARRIGGNIAAYTVAAVIMSGVLFNVSKLPYPKWFEVGIVTTVLLAVIFPSLGERAPIVQWTKEA